MASVRERLAARGLAPSRRRGQNFLRSPVTAERIVALLELRADDAVVEIGPGLGDLTLALAAQARRVVGLEIDRGLVAALRELELPETVEIRHEDALRADLGALARELGPPSVLVGNLPYAIAGRFLAHLLGPRTPFRLFGFMVQAEVASRLLAEPATRDYGPLAVWTRLFTRARRALVLGPEAFVPRPRVHSAFVIFDPLPDPPELASEKLLRNLVRSAFQHRRKTLRAALRPHFPGIESAFEKIGIDSARRGETLSESEFVRLANELSRNS